MLDVLLNWNYSGLDLVRKTFLVKKRREEGNNLIPHRLAVMENSLKTILKKSILGSKPCFVWHAQTPGPNRKEVES